MTDPPHKPVHLIYRGFDRKTCQVQLAPTALGSTRRSAPGIAMNTAAWSANVAWTRGPGQSSYLERFEEERVRAALML